MPDNESAEETATGTEESNDTATTDQLPDDHPLVKTLEAQKATIKELKARTKRLDEIEEASKTEAEKTADRIAKAEAEAATVPAKVAGALKEHLAGIHGFEPEDVELFLTATDPELLLKQVTRLLGQSGKRKNHVPREGANNRLKPNSTQEFLSALTGQG